jgi:hypothetical protein
MKLSPVPFALISGAVTILFIICLPLPHWMAVVGEKDVGPWNQEGHSSDKYYASRCTDEMSMAECGYLRSLQVSSVLTILFGFFSTLVYFIPPTTVSAVSFFLATSGNMVQCIMALLTLVIFSFFKKHYFDDDGINQEYPEPDQTTYSIVFWLWMSGLIVLGLSTSTAYYVARASTYTRKGMLNLGE